MSHIFNTNLYIFFSSELCVPGLYSRTFKCKPVIILYRDTGYLCPSCNSVVTCYSVPSHPFRNKTLRRIASNLLLWHFYHSYKLHACGSIMICLTLKLFTALNHFHITNPRFIYFSKYSNELFRLYQQDDMWHDQRPFKWAELITATFLI